MIEIYKGRVNEERISYETMKHIVEVNPKNRFEKTIITKYMLPNKGWENKVNSVELNVMLGLLYLLIECVLCWYFPIFMGILYSFNVGFSMISFVFASGSSKLARKNRGAEHKIFNAYTKLKRVPTLEEAKEFSCFTRCDGTNLVFTKLIVYCFFWIVPIPVCKVTEVLTLLKVSWIFTPLQIFVTSTPDDENLVNAILALEGLIEVEDSNDLWKIREKKETFFTSSTKKLFRKVDYEYFAMPGCTIEEIEQFLEDYFSFSLAVELTIHFQEIVIVVNAGNYRKFGQEYQEKLLE